eukprot:scaffold7783_cov85-Skeletonema_dohrnii-CCMP3373.AAC.3
MSDNDNNNIRQSELLSDELRSYCRSHSLSEEGVRQIFERNGLTPTNLDHDDVGNYQFFFKACRNRRVTEGIIRFLLEQFPAAISAIDEDGWSPLHFACCNANMTLNIIQLLIDAAPDSVRSVDEEGWMPLHCLCNNKHIDDSAALEILKLLIEKHPEALRHATNNGCLPIHRACGNKNVKLNIVKLLIDAAPDSVRSVDQDGYMPLNHLCINEELDERAALEILKLLIEKHPDSIRHADNDGGFPIHCAASGGKTPEFCRVLIEESPGSERIAEVGGELPLHYASRSNTVAAVKYLYKIYPDAINHADTDGCYPIHFAIKRSRRRKIPIDTVEIVKFLLDCDVNVKLQMVDGLSLLRFACKREYDDSNIEAALAIIKVIYDAYPEAIEDDDIVSDIIESYHEQVIAFIICQLDCSRQAADLRLMMTPDDNGQLPLHTALQNNVRLGSIKLLVKGNLSAIRSIDDSGRLPLHVACAHHNSASVIQYLIGLANVTLDAIDRQGNTVLHYACRGAKYDTIALLLETYDALSVSKRNAHGKLPIDLLWESSEVLDRESTEYTESVFRLLKVYPETVMNIGIKKYQSASASRNGKKRKFGREE